MTGETDTLPPTSEQKSDAAGTRVVLVDARPDRRSVMRQVFEHSGVDAAVVGEADTAAQAIVLVDQDRADLAVVDLPLPAQDGLATVEALRQRFPGLAIVVISFNTDAAVRAQALTAGAGAYLVKPVSAREIVAAIPTAPSTPAVV